MSATSNAPEWPTIPATLEGAKQHDQGLPSEHLFITQHINSNKVTINCNIVSKNLIIIIVCIVEKHWCRRVATCVRLTYTL